MFPFAEGFTLPNGNVNSVEGNGSNFDVCYAESGLFFREIAEKTG